MLLIRPSHAFISAVKALLLMFLGIAVLVAPSVAGATLLDANAAVPMQNDNPPLFLPVVTYGLGGLSPQTFTVADVNGDGVADLVVADCQPVGLASCGNLGSSAEGAVTVFPGNGDGTFGTPLSYDPGTANANSVEVADVNLDGKPDLVVAACGFSGTPQCGNSDGGVISVMLGNGDGTFQQGTIYSSGGISAISVKVADMNGDVIPDIIVASIFDTYYNAKSGVVAVLLGKGNGTFSTAVAYSSGQVGATAVAVADLNGDHVLDVAVSNGACPDTSVANCAGVLLGNGDGTLQPVASYLSGGGEVTSIAIADVNGDLRPDLLLTNWCTSSCVNTAGVLLGNGDGTFQPVLTYATGGNGAWWVAVADVNGDDKLDLVVANQCTGVNFCLTSKGTIGVLLGNGDGTFQTASSYDPGGHSTSFIATADVNGDAKPDVLVANPSRPPEDAGSVGVLLNNKNPFDVT